MEVLQIGFARQSGSVVSCDCNIVITRIVDPKMAVAPPVGCISFMEPEALGISVSQRNKIIKFYYTNRISHEFTISLVFIYILYIL